MTPAATRHLAGVIGSLIRGTVADYSLASGALLRYRPPDGADDRHRLLLYRVGAVPTARELAQTRQALERAIGRAAMPAESWQHGQLVGYLLPWRAEAQQGALPLEMPAAQRFARKHMEVIAGK